MARRPELLAFARRHKLRITSVAAIAMHRRQTEKLIALEQEINFPTDLGLFKMRMYRRHHRQQASPGARDGRAVHAGGAAGAGTQRMPDRRRLRLAALRLRFAVARSACR
jgi:hypothetical protein